MGTTRNADPPEVYICIESFAGVSLVAGQDVFIESGHPGSRRAPMLPAKYPNFFVGRGRPRRRERPTRAAFRRFETGREKIELERQRARASEPAQSARQRRLGGRPAVRAIKRSSGRHRAAGIMLEEGDQLARRAIPSSRRTRRPSRRWCRGSPRRREHLIPATSRTSVVLRRARRRRGSARRQARAGSQADVRRPRRSPPPRER